MHALQFLKEAVGALQQLWQLTKLAALVKAEAMPAASLLAEA